MAGLAAARAVALRGVAVDVYEAGTKTGGCCATTPVGGYTFDDGALFVAFPGLLDALFARLGLDRAARVPLQRIATIQRCVFPDGTAVTLGGRGELTVEGNEAATAAAREELEAFLRTWDPLLALFGEDILMRPLSLVRLGVRGWRHLHRLRGTARARLREAFRNEPVRAALAAALLYTGKPSDEAPAAALLALAALFRQGYFIPSGGMGRIPEALDRAASDAGATIRRGMRVARVLVRGGRVTGVEVQGEGAREADAVISTVAAMRTYGSLLERDAIPARMARKVRRTPLSQKGFALQLGLANRIDTAAYSNYRIPFLDAEREVLEPDRERLRWPIFMVPTVAVPELAPPGGSVIEMYPPIPQHLAAAEWTEARKEEIAAQAIARLRESHRLDIAARRIVSPREFESDVGLYEGALYGISPVAGPGALFAHRTPIRGLYQAGQTSWPGFGVAPSGWSGVMAADALLEEMA